MKDALLSRLFLRFRERGDGAALALVFDATARELFDVAAHLAASADEAEDLVQHVYLRALERANTFDARRGLRPWLFGILWREARKARRQGARRVDPSKLREREVPDPAEVVAAFELPEAVRAALDGAFEVPFRVSEHGARVIHS